MWKRGKPNAAVSARVAPAALKGGRTVLELPAAYGVHLLPAGVCMQTPGGDNDPLMNDGIARRCRSHLCSREQGCSHRRDCRRHRPRSACQDRRLGHLQNPHSGDKRDTLKFLTENFTWDHAVPAGQLPIAMTGETVDCAPILMQALATRLPTLFR